LFGALRPGPADNLRSEFPNPSKTMRHAPSTMHFSHAFASRAFRPAVAGAIEWEELPSLAGSLDKRPNAARQTPWDATRPAELDAAVPSQPFREPVNGLAIREVNEPDVFRHFFGA
jgi:hypothetical protein